MLQRRGTLLVHTGRLAIGGAGAPFDIGASFGIVEGLRLKSGEREWLPASPETIGLYVGTRAKDLALATLERRLSFINVLHKDEGYDAPATVAEGPLRLVWHRPPPSLPRALPGERLPCGAGRPHPHRAQGPRPPPRRVGRSLAAERDRRDQRRGRRARPR